LELAGKLVSFAASLLALFGVVALAANGRTWATQQAIKAVRDELAYVRDELKRKDEELHNFRQQRKEHEEKLKHLERRFAELEVIERNRRLAIYTFREYVRRLETNCGRRGVELPERPEGLDDL